MIKLRELKVKVILMEINNFSNPKLINDKNKFGFQYYAGYSSKFVEDAISNLRIGKEDIILDPWNGSGTTTTVASVMGYKNIGLDINPVMTIIAKSRVLTKDETLIDDVNQVIKSFKNSKSIVNNPNDLLLNWFSGDSVKVLRLFENSIQKKVMKLKKPELLINFKKFDEIDSKTAFFYLIFFEVVKSFAKTFKVSNPTWIKKPKEENKKITITKSEVKKEFVKLFDKFYIQLNEYLEDGAQFKVASSNATMLEDSSISYIITSPPYCTRIDYAVATSIELSILGYEKESFEDLRLRMIGTTKIINNLISDTNKWGEYANAFLNNVYSHPSKASTTYYYKQFFQYFDGMYKSFTELNRVLKKNGQIIIVVQDSYYKNIYLNLSQVFTEMASNLSWTLVTHEEYVAKSIMSRINRKSTVYEKNQDIVEHILVYEKKENLNGQN